MRRQISLGDIACIREASALIARHGPDIVHGHGAKGAAYGRLAPRPPA